MKPQENLHVLLGVLTVTALMALSRSASADDLKVGTSDEHSAASVEAIELKPVAGKSFELAGATGSVYYTADGQDYRVVTTLNSPERAAPMRFVASLSDGQSIFIDVPMGVGEEPAEMRVERDGESIGVILPKAQGDLSLTPIDEVLTGTIN